MNFQSPSSEYDTHSFLCNILAHPELQKTAREVAKSIPFSSCLFKCPLLAARHPRRPSYKAMLVKDEQSVLTQEETSKGKKKKNHHNTFKIYKL